MSSQGKCHLLCKKPLYSSPLLSFPFSFVNNAKLWSTLTQNAMKSNVAVNEKGFKCLRLENENWIGLKCNHVSSLTLATK
jgi:hypothetical protein